MPARRSRSPLVAPNTWPPVVPQTGGAERNGACTAHPRARTCRSGPAPIIAAGASEAYESPLFLYMGDIFPEQLARTLILNYGTPLAQLPAALDNKHRSSTTVADGEEVELE